MFEKIKSWFKKTPKLTNEEIIEILVKTYNKKADVLDWARLSFINKNINPDELYRELFPNTTLYCADLYPLKIHLQNNGDSFILNFLTTKDMIEFIDKYNLVVGVDGLNKEIRELQEEIFDLKGLVYRILEKEPCEGG